MSGPDHRKLVMVGHHQRIAGLAFFQAELAFDAGHETEERPGQEHQHPGVGQQEPAMTPPPRKADDGGRQDVQASRPTRAMNQGLL